MLGCSIFVTLETINSFVQKPLSLCESTHPQHFTGHLTRVTPRPLIALANFLRIQRLH